MAIINREYISSDLMRISGESPDVVILPPSKGAIEGADGVVVPKNEIRGVTIWAEVNGNNVIVPIDADGKSDGTSIDGHAATDTSPYEGMSGAEILDRWTKSPEANNTANIIVHYPSYDVNYEIKGNEYQGKQASVSVEGTVKMYFKGDSVSDNVKTLLSNMAYYFQSGAVSITTDDSIINGKATTSETDGRFETEWRFDVTDRNGGSAGQMENISLNELSSIIEKDAGSMSPSALLVVEYAPSDGVVRNYVIEGVDACIRDIKDDIARDENDNVDNGGGTDNADADTVNPASDTDIPDTDADKEYGAYTNDSGDAHMDGADSYDDMVDDETPITYDDDVPTYNPVPPIDADVSDSLFGTVSAPVDTDTSDALFGQTDTNSKTNDTEGGMTPGVGADTQADGGATDTATPVSDTDKSAGTNDEPQKGLPAFATRDPLNTISQSLDRGSIPVFMLGGNKLSCEGLTITEQDIKTVREASPDFGVRLGFDSSTVKDSNIEKVSFEDIKGYIFDDDEGEKAFAEKYDVDNIYVVRETQSPINPTVTATYNGRDMDYRPSNRITVLAYKKIDADISDISIRALPDAACFLADSAGGFVEHLPLFSGITPDDSRYYEELPLDWGAMKVDAEAGVGIQFAAEDEYKGMNSDAPWQNMGDIVFDEDPYKKSTDGFMSVMGDSFKNNINMFLSMREEKESAESRANQSITASDAGMIRLAQPVHDLQKAITDHLNTDSKDVAAHRDSLKNVMKAAISIYPDAKLASLDERPEHLNTRTQIAEEDSRVYNAVATAYDNFDTSMKYIYERRSDGTLTGKADTEWTQRDVWKDNEGNTRYFDVFRECVLRAEGISGELVHSDNVDRYVESDIDKEGEKPFTQADIDDHDNMVIRERIFAYNHGDAHYTPKIDENTGNIERSNDGRGNIRYKQYISKDTLRPKEEQIHISKDGRAYTNDGHAVLPFRPGKFPTTTDERNKVMYERYNPAEDRTLPRREAMRGKCDFETYVKRMEAPLLDGSSTTRGQYAVNAYRNVFEQTHIRDVDGNEVDVVDKDYLARMGVGIMDTNGVIANMLAVVPDGKFIAERVQDIVSEGRYFVRRDDIDAVNSAIVDDRIHVDNPTTDSVVDAVAGNSGGPFDGGGWTAAPGLQYDESGNPLDSSGRALTYGQLNRDPSTDVSLSKVKELELRQEALTEAKEIGKRDKLDDDAIKQKSEELYAAKRQATIEELRGYVNDARKYEAVMTSYRLPRMLEGSHMTVQYAKYQHTAALYKYERAGGASGRTCAVTKGVSVLDMYMAKKGFTRANYLSTIVYNVVDRHECEVKADRAIRASHDSIVKSAENTVAQMGLTGDKAKAEIKSIVEKAETKIRDSYVDKDKYRIFDFVPQWKDDKGNKVEIRQYRGVAPYVILQLAAYIVPPLINPVFAAGILAASVSSILMAGGMIIMSDIEDAKIQAELSKQEKSLLSSDGVGGKISSILSDISSKLVNIVHPSKEDETTADKKDDVDKDDDNVDSGSERTDSEPDDADSAVDAEKQTDSGENSTDTPTDDEKETVDARDEKNSETVTKDDDSEELISSDEKDKNDDADIIEKEPDDDNVDRDDDTSDNDDGQTVSSDEKDGDDNATSKDENESADERVETGSEDKDDGRAVTSDEKDENSSTVDDNSGDVDKESSTDEKKEGAGGIADFLSFIRDFHRNDKDENSIDRNDKQEIPSDEKKEDAVTDDTREPSDTVDADKEKEADNGQVTPPVEKDEGVDNPNIDNEPPAREDTDDDRERDNVDDGETDDNEAVTQADTDSDEKEKEDVESAVDAVAAYMQQAATANDDDEQVDAQPAEKDKTDEAAKPVVADENITAPIDTEGRPVEGTDTDTSRAETAEESAAKGSTTEETVDVPADTEREAHGNTQQKAPMTKEETAKEETAEDSNAGNSTDNIVDIIVDVAYGTAEMSEFINAIVTPDMTYDTQSLTSAIMSAVDVLMKDGVTAEDILGIGIPEMAGEIASLSNAPFDVLSEISDDISGKYGFDSDFTDEFLTAGANAFSSDTGTPLEPEFMGTVFDNGQMFDADTGNPVDMGGFMQDLEVAGNELTQMTNDDLDAQFRTAQEAADMICGEMERQGIDTTQLNDGVTSIALDQIAADDTLTANDFVTGMTDNDNGFIDDMLDDIAYEPDNDIIEVQDVDAIDDYTYTMDADTDNNNDVAADDFVSNDNYFMYFDSDDDSEEQ